ncbi:MAG: ABC transporter permease [Anaerolineae bacterium]
MIEPPRTRRAPFLSRVARNRLVLVGLVVVIFLVLLAIFPGVFAPYDPEALNMKSALQPPNLEYPFGTDRYGRDILSRVIYGARVSLGVAFSSVAIALLVGSILGIVSGYFGGIWDIVISRVMDVIFSFPMLLLAIALAAMMGPGTENAIRAIAIVNTPFFARVVRGSTLAVREQEYVQAAQVVGARHSRIIARHISPNVASPLIVQTSVTIAYAILTEASLSYLGLGTEILTPTWGNILNEGRTYLEQAPWISIFSGMAIMIAVLAFNLVGDGLRDALDPRVS